jgi:hypothetical protein
MPCDVEVQDATPVMADDEKAVQQVEDDGEGHKIAVMETSSPNDYSQQKHDQSGA